MEVNQIIQQVAETLELTNYSKTLDVVLTNDEKRVMSVKYQSKQFCKMTATEIIQECKLMLLRINVITGWIIPSAELKDILIEQICKKMLETYPNVNVDEVEYAFRNRSTEIKDWGKNFSITLLDDVMLPYIEKRLDVSEVEQKVKTMPIQKIYTEEEILNQRREEIEKSFQAMKKGYYPLLHSYFLEVLRDDDLIETVTDEQGIRFENISEFFVRKLNSKAENIYKKD